MKIDLGSFQIVEVIRGSLVGSQSREALYQSVVVSAFDYPAADSRANSCRPGPSQNRLYSWIL